MTGKDYSETWKGICDIYDKTRDANNPNFTLVEIMRQHDPEYVLETFAAVTKIKKHDGRIYGRNRAEMEKISTSAGIDQWSFDNPLVRSGMIDHIHTAHINNLITELLEWKMEG